MKFSEAIGTVLELATWRIEEMPDEIGEFKTEGIEACEVIASFMERWEDATKEMGGEGVIASFMKQMEGDEKDK